jgi:hypothetical protein
MAKRKPPIGSVWRIKYDEAPKKRGGIMGESFDLLSADYFVGRAATRVSVRTIFDEFVLAFPSGCIHLEQMSERTWYLGIGDEKVMITVDKDGVPRMGEWYT